jgi:hypothetical protein
MPEYSEKVRATAWDLLYEQARRENASVASRMDTCLEKADAHVALITVVTERGL